MIVQAYSTMREPSELDFPHDLNWHRTLDDAELVPSLNDVIAVASDRGHREMTPTLYSVLRHLERTRHHFSFAVDGDSLDKLAVWGWDTNSILHMPDDSLRDPAGRVLVDAGTGAAEPNATVPFPLDAIDRRGRSREELSVLSIETLADLPPVIGEGEVVMRPGDEVGWRTLALFIVAVRAESLATGTPISAEQLRAKSPMAFEALSPEEIAFLENDSPDEMTVVKFSWRYEALFTLQWALGLHGELPFPDQICDVPKVAETMVDRSDRDIVTSARLRRTSTILDAVDLNQRMLWAARQAAMEKREPPKKIDGGILSERQHALNWLIQQGGQPWDAVDTPT